MIPNKIRALVVLVGVFLWLMPLNDLMAQSRYTIKGYIRDAENGEGLIGATVYVNELKSGTATNYYGFYSLTLPAGTYQLTFNYVGYQPMDKQITLEENMDLDVELAPEAEQLQEVVVKGERDDANVSDLDMSTNKVDMEQVKKLPPLFGEPDIIKTIQMMPGVLVAGEGSSAFFVRGGGVDQNLVLLDEAPIYDPSHLFGLVSVFNASTIKSSELMKGGIPAQYGGRLASVLDVRTKDGNKKQFDGELGLGLLSMKALVEGPIIKNKSSFIVSGRRSWLDVILPSDAILRPGFHDLNAKVNFTINNNNNVFLSFYNGRDRLNLLDGLLDWNWGNQTSTLRWNHIFNDKLFSNTTLIYSNFDYANTQDFPGFGLLWTSNLQEYSLKEDLEYYLTPTNTINFGYHTSYKIFEPGKFEPTDPESIVSATEMDRMYAWENAIYGSQKIDVNSRLSLEYGIRLSAFSHVGSSTVYDYEEVSDPTLKVNAGVTDTTQYDRGEIIKTYFNPEPRFSARYTLNNVSSLKLSYNRMVQYVHQMVTGTSPLPIAIWQPSNKHIKPQKADQVAGGYFRNFNDNMYETSAEVYYKQMYDIIDFRDNAQVFFNEHLPLEIAPGNSQSYGLELFARKAKGDLTGWASYTLSKTTRKIPGVNNNQVFPASYDRRHNATLVATYDLNDRISFGGNFIYGTGRGLTLPKGVYLYKNQVVHVYTGRNEFRMPDFHRLDLSVTIRGKEKPGKNWMGETNISLYNVYGRRNPFLVFSQTKTEDDGSPSQVRDADGNLIQAKEIVQVNLFGILPSVSYTINFN